MHSLLVRYNSVMDINILEHLDTASWTRDIEFDVYGIKSCEADEHGINIEFESEEHKNWFLLEWS